MTTWHHALLLMDALGSHASAAIAEPQVSVDTFIQASDNRGNAPQLPLPRSMRQRRARLLTACGTNL